MSGPIVTAAIARWLGALKRQYSYRILFIPETIGSIAYLSKNYKKMNANFDSINGYQFEHDIVFFIRDELKINNDELLHYCKNNPVFLFSEISKYLINNHQYSSDQTVIDEKNHILDIRKSIFENKKNNFNIKKLYFNIKKEAEYKKLSFLTY